MGLLAMTHWLSGLDEAGLNAQLYPRAGGREMTPNPAIDRSAQQRGRCWVPVALRAPAPGHCERWTPNDR